MGGRRSQAPRDETSPVGPSSAALVPRRHVFDFNQALMDFECDGLRRTRAPDACCPRWPKGCSELSLPIRKDHDRRRLRRDRRARSPIPRDSAVRGAYTSEGYWEFPGGRCDPQKPSPGCLATGTEGRARPRHPCGQRAARRPLTSTPSARSSCTSSYATRSEKPSPQLGQEVLWAQRDQIETSCVPASRHGA